MTSPLLSRLSIDENLEALIDEAGRDDVFAAVMALGWKPGDDVPRYIWQEMAYRVAERKRSSATPSPP